MKKIITLSMFFAACSLFAQEENKLSVSGSIDAYYQTHLSAADNSGQSFGTSFADRTGFAIGMANAIISYEGAKTGMVADLVFGPRGVDAAGSGSDLYVNQLYAYWNVSESTTLTMGRFNTYLGYEVISPVGNFNYSTSYLFSSGPFSHLGLKADFALSEDFSLMLAVMNETDVYDNMTGDYALGAQLGYAGQYLNFYYAAVGLGLEIDYTGGFDLSDSFFLGLNAAYADNDGEGFTGAALYPQVAVSDSFSLGLRGEYFDWLSDASTTIDDQDVLALTLTGSYTLDNLTIKPELRLDSNSQDVYIDNDAAATKSLAAFTLAAIYSF
ncbi:outer membrane beta-barrel protein [Algibacter miyuki]|uniref:Outer membrane beta-barrel protein n=1 Tax=Algibacter miyuki TaxID=1306933 RepID=A0ABV5GW78_9FLAO|nr:outer membrane beta-barrel protein [Algibacter miyuki]MDN3665234.1 outer membrane beta-barrel protein [Algibacter miyuki]